MVAAGSFFGSADSADNIAGFFSAKFFSEEMVGIDCDKEMTEVVRRFFAVFIDAVEVFTVSTVLENGAEKFDNHSIAVTFITAESFAYAAESGESGGSLTYFFKSYSRVAGNGIAVDIDNCTGMNGFAYSFVIFDFAVLSNSLPF